MNPGNVQRGRAIRRAMANAILPCLPVSAHVPSTKDLSRALGMSPVMAWKHRRRMLAEHGVVVRRDGNRLLVTARPA